MSEKIRISLSGTPQGKGRARSTLIKPKYGKPFVSSYTPEATRSYESMIRGRAMDAMEGRTPFQEAVAVNLVAVFDVPVSWSKKKRAAALAGGIKPGKKPDLDNILKAWTDAMNSVVFRDDALIVQGSFEKVYGLAPSVTVEVWAV